FRVFQTDLLEELHAGHSRKVQVTEHEVLGLLQDTQSLWRIDRHRGLVTVPLELCVDDMPQARIILDNEYPPGLHIGMLELAGNIIETVIPASGFRSTWSTPPCLMIIC